MQHIRVRRRKKFAMDRAMNPTDSTGSADGVDASTFRSMMSSFPTGVAVVTAVDAAGRQWGMTCSSLCSVTLEPPTLLVCLRAVSPTLAAISGRGTFTVNLLHAGARGCAEVFSTGVAERFDRVAWSAGRGAGPHLTEAALAVADCSVRMTQRVGSHVVVFGEVFGLHVNQGRAPLLYGRRVYATWPEVPAR
jgi:flavin reductase (DIM6/NTAB) family NADH-FMN oxidoreductase RutF